MLGGWQRQASGPAAVAAPEGPGAASSARSMRVRKTRRARWAGRLGSATRLPDRFGGTRFVRTVMADLTCQRVELGRRRAIPLVPPGRDGHEHRNGLAPSPPPPRPSRECVAGSGWRRASARQRRSNADSPPASSSSRAPAIPAGPRPRAPAPGDRRARAPPRPARDRRDRGTRPERTGCPRRHATAGRTRRRPRETR